MIVPSFKPPETNPRGLGDRNRAATSAGAKLIVKAPCLSDEFMNSFKNVCIFFLCESGVSEEQGFSWEIGFGNGLVIVLAIE